MLPTYMSSGIFLCIWCFGLALVQSVPLTRDESSSSESSRCQSYTHWDVSEERCVSCTEVCNAGEELKEDCGYSPTGDPIADPCRQCPSGTYSSSGQEQCQACEICPNGYQQECSPTQPAICLGKEDEELAPDGVSCQKTCCYCQYDADEFDRLDDCVRRHYSTPALQNYICKKGSYSAGETCKTPPTTPSPVVTSITTASPKTTPHLQNVTTTYPTVTVSDSTSEPGTIAPTVHPLGPTHPASSGSPPTVEARTTEEPNTTVAPNPPPKPKGNQPPWYMYALISAGCIVLLSVTCCCCYRRNREKIAAFLQRTDNVQYNRLLAGIEQPDENYTEEGVAEEADLDGEEVDEEGGEEEGHLKDEGPDKEEDNGGDADSGTVSDSKESSDAGSEKRDSPFCSKDSLLEPESCSVDSADGQGDDETHPPEHTEETGQPMDPDAQPVGTETTPKEMESCVTIEFAETIEGPPNDPRSLKARPSGGGPYRPQPGVGQPPPYPGQGQGQGAPAAGQQPAVSISGGVFNGNVTFVIGGNNYHNYPAPAAGDPPQDGNDRIGADGNANDGAGPTQADGNRRQPAPRDEDGRPVHPPGNGNDRARNRRHPVVPDIQVSILPNPARVGQNVRFSCDLPDNMDPHACEFRWMKQGQLDQVARGQSFNKDVQQRDAGVYTCEVTTADGQVLEGQAVLEIIEDGAEGGTSVSGCARRARDHDSDQPSRKRLRTGTPGSQGFSNPSGQIQVPDFIQHKPLEEILDHEDLLSKLQVKLEQFDRRHWRNVGSHFRLSNEQLKHIEYKAGISNNSPLRSVLEKVTTTEDKTVGDLLKYCNDTLERRDVVHTVVDYFEKEEQENQEGETEVKEGVEEDSFVADRCSEQAKDTDSVEIDELKELRAVTSEADMAINDMPEKSVLAQAVARKKLESCDFNSGEFELVELQS